MNFNIYFNGDCNLVITDKSSIIIKYNFINIPCSVD